MKIRGLTDEDFVNYKKPSMFIAFPTCSFKCEKECGVRCCQNSPLAAEKEIEIDSKTLAARYLDNPITSAVVCGGLEPFDSFVDLCSLINTIREFTDDDIVVYTGYKPDEIKPEIALLRGQENIIVKYGRYIPGQKSHFDPVLGVMLASDNQFAERISS